MGRSFHLDNRGIAADSLPIAPYYGNDPRLAKLDENLKDRLTVSGAQDCARTAPKKWQDAAMNSTRHERFEHAARGPAGFERR